MRLTIIAGLILGTSLAIQSMLGAHATAKLGRAANGVHVRVVAPWYIAASGRIGDAHSYPSAVTKGG